MSGKTPYSPLVGIACVAVIGCVEQTTYRLEYQVQDGVVATPGVVIEAEEEPSFRLEAGRPFHTPFFSQCSYPTVENWAENEQHGARRVRVFHPGLHQALYGVLALCKIENDYKGAAARSLRLEVPQARVDATDGGRMSYVTELYEVKGQSFPAWTLWLSREPIPHP